MNLQNRNLKIFQWNCHGLLNKIETTTQIFIENADNFDIFTLSETRLTPEKNFYIRGFNIIPSDGSSGKSGGVLIAIKNNIPFHKISNLFSEEHLLETVGISIPRSNNFLYIISLYKHPGNTSLQIWNKLVNFIPSLNNVILMGDVNAHHVSWGSSHLDNMGKLLLNP